MAVTLLTIDEKLDAILAAIEDLQFKSYITCGRCQGVGTVIPSHTLGIDNPNPISCPICNGAKRIQTGTMDEAD